VGLLSVLPADVVAILPPKWRPYIGGAVLLAVWVKGHRNLLINPDGTPALTAWVADSVKKE
jgi:hypothetical protein